MTRILYFADLVDGLDCASEEVQLPATVTDVRSLLEWLRLRGGNWERLLTEDAVRVTLDRQFTAPETKIAGSREIAIVPR